MSNARTIADYANDDGISGNKIDGGTISNSALATTVTMSANHPAVKTAINSSGSAPIYACRAWVNFNGTSGTTEDNKTIRAHGNVSSVYENTAGNYQINFVNSMPHENYAVAVFGSNEANSNITLPTFGGPEGISPAGAARSTYQQTGSVRVYFTNPASYTGAVDKETVTVAIFC